MGRMDWCGAYCTQWVGAIAHCGAALCAGVLSVPGPCLSKPTGSTAHESLSPTANWYGLSAMETRWPCAIARVPPDCAPFTSVGGSVGQKKLHISAEGELNGGRPKAAFVWTKRTQIEQGRQGNVQLKKGIVPN